MQSEYTENYTYLYKLNFALGFQPALLIKIIRAISKSDNGAARVRFEITKSGSPGYVMYVRDESSEQILARPENH